jgi:hypothetical protein
MSIVRVGLSETSQYSAGWAAIFGGAKRKTKKSGARESGKRSAQARRAKPRPAGRKKHKK